MKIGQKVKSTKEYQRIFKKGFSGKVLENCSAGIVLVGLDCCGSKISINQYWLKKKGCCLICGL